MKQTCWKVMEANKRNDRNMTINTIKVLEGLICMKLWSNYNKRNSSLENQRKVTLIIDKTNKRT